jgi:hypothetical protein
MMSYNGWTNYETWNVALWIGNDDGLYNMARAFRNNVTPFADFVANLGEFGGDIAKQTPDGVRWDDSEVDKDEIQTMFDEL